MKEITYNKLVRDKIPQIIEASGKTCETEVLSDERYLEMLDKKLNEELAEYQQEKSLEELADLLEVLYAVAVARGVRAEKKDKRGGFAEKIFLIKVTED